jgi:hypothetical protein
MINIFIKFLGKMLSIQETSKKGTWCMNVMTKILNPDVSS